MITRELTRNIRFITKTDKGFSAFVSMRHYDLLGSKVLLFLPKESGDALDSIYHLLQVAKENPQAALSEAFQTQFSKNLAQFRDGAVHLTTEQRVGLMSAWQTTQGVLANNAKAAAAKHTY